MPTLLTFQFWTIFSFGPKIGLIYSRIGFILYSFNLWSFNGQNDRSHAQIICVSFLGQFQVLFPKSGHFGGIGQNWCHFWNSWPRFTPWSNFRFLTPPKKTRILDGAYPINSVIRFFSKFYFFNIAWRGRAWRPRARLLEGWVARRVVSSRASCSGITHRLDLRKADTKGVHYHQPIKTRKT